MKVSRLIIWNSGDCWFIGYYELSSLFVLFRNFFYRLPDDRCRSRHLQGNIGIIIIILYYIYILLRNRKYRVPEPNRKLKIEKQKQRFLIKFLFSNDLHRRFVKVPVSETWIEVHGRKYYAYPAMTTCSSPLIVTDKYDNIFNRFTTFLSRVVCARVCVNILYIYINIKRRTMNLIFPKKNESFDY